MNITIRRIGEPDFEQLLGLFREFATFELLPDRMTNSVEQMKEEKAFFRGFVAETAGGKIVGYASYFFCYYTWTGKSLYLDDLYIKPEYRGRGIGSDLIRRGIGEARANGCHRVRWQVSKWNRLAIDFYRKIGAEINDVEQNCDLTVP
jgi:ribosomal protein S18 acetylase RimI-like enzyme